MTVREWLRGARGAHVPASDEEARTLAAARAGDWAAAEFWLLLWASRPREAAGAPWETHRWDLDGYSWRCRDCGASVASEAVGETTVPPGAFSTECGCAACRPCVGNGDGRDG